MFRKAVLFHRMGVRAGRGDVPPPQALSIEGKESTVAGSVATTPKNSPLHTQP